jgi:formate dehydrogenase major subunit
MFKLHWVRPNPSGGVSRAPQPYSPASLKKVARTEGAVLTHGVCPYCAVGCGIDIYTKGGMLVDIEGNPSSPINEGTLCPKGANTFQTAVNEHRIQYVQYRAAYSDKWETKPLEWAMDRIAHLVKDVRDRDFAEKGENGKTMNSVRTMGTLGGAVLDNEENYLIKKLFNGGLGVISIENQARI